MWKFLIKNIRVIYGLIFISLLFYLAFTKIGGDGDFWWLMALGRHFWETGQVTNYDMLSHTFANGFFWNHSRLFDVIVYGLFHWGSYLLLDIFRFLLFLTTYYFLYKTVVLKKYNFLVTAIVFSVSLWFLADRLLYRPELVSMLLSAILLFLLFKDKTRSSKLVYLVPVVQLIWANSHAGFVYGLATIGIFFGAELIRSLLRHRDNTLEIIQDRRLKKIFLIFLLSCLATLLNSYAWQIFVLAYNLTLPQEALSGIGEWGVYAWQNLFSFLNPLSILFWFSILVLLAKIYQIPKNKLISKLKYYPWEEIFLFLLYLYSTLKHGRFIYLFSVILAVIIAKNIFYLFKSKYLNKLSVKLFLHIFLLFFLVLVTYKFFQKPFGLAAANNRYPQTVTQFILEQHLPGKMLNEYLDGGYFAFWLYPEKQVSIDGRTPNLYSNDFFWRYDNLLDENIREKMLADYDINFIVWPRKNELNQILWQDPNWQMIYFDDLSVVYFKNTEENKAWLDKFAYQFFASFYNEESLPEVCSADNLQKNPDLKNNLIQEVEKAIQLNQDIYLYYQDLALIYQYCQFNPEDKDKIKDYFLQALELHPDDKNLNYQLAFAYLQLEDNQNALYYFKQAGKNQQAYLVGLGTAQYNLGEYKQALKTMLKARKLSGKIDKKYYQTLARIYYQLDQNKLSIEFFHRYLDLTQDFTAEMYTELAWAYYDDQNSREAKVYLKKALELDLSYQSALDLEKIIGSN